MCFNLREINWEEEKECTGKPEKEGKGRGEAKPASTVQVNVTFKPVVFSDFTQLGGTWGRGWEGRKQRLSPRPAEPATGEPRPEETSLEAGE